MRRVVGRESSRDARVLARDGSEVAIVAGWAVGRRLCRWVG